MSITRNGLGEVKPLPQGCAITFAKRRIMAQTGLRLYYRAPKGIQWRKAVRLLNSYKGAQWRKGGPNHQNLSV